MHQIVENFERNARFKDDNEAEIIRQKLEMLVSSIQVQVAKRDKPGAPNEDIVQNHLT